MRGAAVSGDDKPNWIPSTPIAFAIAVSRPYARWATLALAAVLVATAASRLMTWTLKLLTDSAIAYGAGRGELAPVWRWALVFPAVYLANEFVWRTSGFCGMRWITGAVAEGSRRLFGYLSDHSAGYFADRYAGALVNKIANAASGTERLISQWLWQFFPWIVGLLADLWITNLAHPWFALGLLGWLLVYVPVNVYAVSKLHRLSFAYAEASSTLRGKMVDTTANIDTVQHTGELDYERRFIGESIGQQRVSHLREWWWSEWLLVTNGLLLAVFILSMFGVGIHLLAGGRISVGSLVMVVTVVMALEQRMFFLGQNMTQAVSYHGQVAEGLAELLQPHEIEDRPGAAPLVVKRAQIRFERLLFSHKNSRVFGGDFDLAIAGGEKVGLVGHSGAGKSTLVGLLLRQFELDGGRILIDGQSVSQITLESLRRAVALVPQTTSLFHRSIMDNIRYGRLAASDEEVWEAAQLAEADAFIRELPEGYLTKVGERGVKLSGGQRQRIAIARALLRRAPILLLDEATSALDSESEAAIQHALVGLMRDKTVIAIAHRLSTLRAMDRIVVVEQGRIVEDGRHESLVRQGGVYASLWNSQVSGFIPD
jgi:ATP-binding cassette subfamily B protein